MDLTQPRNLGQTGLRVGRLGLAGGYGAPAEAFEEAFERGCNYFYWGSMRKEGMRRAIMNLCGRGKRDDLVILLQSYTRSPRLMEVFIKRALKSLRLDRAEILLLGWYNRPPARRILDRALEMKEKGLCRFLGLSGHNRPLFARLAGEGSFDLFHVRYNAAHRGADEEVFAALGQARPGLVTYTATRWGQLLKAKYMPPGQEPPPASDCYRFALSHPAVDVCLCGPRDLAQMKEALRTLDRGPLSREELDRMRRIGDFVHARKKGFF